MSANDARKQSLYFPEDMLNEIQQQAQRLPLPELGRSTGVEDLQGRAAQDPVAERHARRRPRGDPRLIRPGEARTPTGPGRLRLPRTRFVYSAKCAPDHRPRRARVRWARQSLPSAATPRSALASTGARAAPRRAAVARATLHSADGHGPVDGDLAVAGRPPRRAGGPRRRGRPTWMETSRIADAGLHHSAIEAG